MQMILLLRPSLVKVESIKEYYQKLHNRVFLVVILNISAFSFFKMDNMFKESL